MATTHRPARQAQHHAHRDPEEIRADAEMEEYYRADYIDFINKLMQRMRMDSIKRMLEAALKEIE